MDGRRFDELTRALGSPENRRGFVKGLLGAGLAAVGLGRFSGSQADAQVSQVYCGNQMCASNPGGCKPGCVCCAYTNAVTGTVINSRCRPPGTCSPGTTVCPPGTFADPALGCVACLTAANCPAGGNPCQLATCTQGVCGLQPGNAGATCGQTTCTGGAVTSYACNAAGACAANTPVPCDPFVCAADSIACRTQCGDDTHCVPGTFCNGGTCSGDLALGSPCTRASQCLSGYCTDGVCCEVESCGECHTCGVGPSPGTCFALLGLPCAAEPCNQGICMDGRCTQQAAGDGAQCGQSGECSISVCSGGSCVPQSANEGDRCGDGGTDCNPKKCVGGACRSVPESGSSCANNTGLCFDGDCCIGGTTSGICAIGENRNCCATEPCCGPGSCCVDCFSEPSDSGGPDLPVCCPPTSLCPPNTPNAPGCCYEAYQSCIQTSPGSYACIHEDRICGGAVCDGDCCLGDCCEDGLYCNGAACVTVPSTSCTTDAQCGTNLRCVGIKQTTNTQTGETTTTPGTCCPSSQACQIRPDGPPDGQAFDMCLPYGSRCGFPGPTGSCPNSRYVQCSGLSTPCDCSPRGGRTRL